MAHLHSTVRSPVPRVTAAQKEKKKAKERTDPGPEPLSEAFFFGHRNIRIAYRGGFLFSGNPIFFFQPDFLFFSPGRSKSYPPTPCSLTPGWRFLHNAPERCALIQSFFLLPSSPSMMVKRAGQLSFFWPPNGIETIVSGFARSN